MTKTYLVFTTFDEMINHVIETVCAGHTEEGGYCDVDTWEFIILKPDQDYMPVEMGELVDDFRFHGNFGGCDGEHRGRCKSVCDQYLIDFSGVFRRVADVLDGGWVVRVLVDQLESRRNPR